MKNKLFLGILALLLLSNLLGSYQTFGQDKPDDRTLNTARNMRLKPEERGLFFNVLDLHLSSITF